VIGLLNPRRLRELLSAGDQHSRFRSAVMMRIILGGMLLAAAPSCHYPIVVTYLGVAVLVAAVGVYLIGERRFGVVSDWWSDRPIMSVRAMSMLALDVGLFLYYAPH
jgi:hypothetical protein